MAKEDIKKAIANAKERRENTTEEKLGIKEVVCFTCLHLAAYPYCFAFPDGDGIPQDIRDGTNLHTEPIEGDDDITYEEYSDIAMEKLLRGLDEDIANLKKSKEE